MTAALIAQLRTHHADKQSFIKSSTRLTNQARARCRTIVAVNNREIADIAESEAGRAVLIKEADKLMKRVIDGANDTEALEARLTITTLLEAKAVIEKAEAIPTRAIEKLARKLPCAAWVDGTLGFGLVSFGQLIAEAGDLNKYGNPDKLKKRMGMAVINGEAQRRCSNAEKAVEHGFNPRRRALMYVIGDTILRAQLRKDAEGNRVARGPLGQYYIESRAKAEAEGKKAPHFWAKRRVEQRLLIELWAEWKAATKSQQSGSGSKRDDTWNRSTQPPAA